VQLKKIIILCVTLIEAAQAQNGSPEKIRLNQIGFYPQEQKTAVVLTEKESTFYIIAPNRKDKLYEGKLSEVRRSSYSPAVVRIADFTSFKTTGTFVLHVDNIGDSYPFEIKNNVFDPIVKGSLKAFYFQRFSTPLTKEFAEKWSRQASPSHQEIIVHPSAATEKRPAGTIVSSTRGWIDAGDYNKYVVNSGITTSTLLSAYEDFPSYYDALDTNIPESKNSLPDILDEVLWNLRWMLTMQDPNDGGVYHKCTNANFDPMVMPDKATTPRFMVKKSTAAALNLAAVMAQASIVFEKFSSQLPGLTDSCRKAALSAWDWAKEHPSEFYDQEKMNQQFDPDINTGGYGDNNLSDEFSWAAAELTLATGNSSRLDGINFLPDQGVQIPSWNQVRWLGYYAIVNHPTLLGSIDRSLVESLKEKIIKAADQFAKAREQNAYQTVMGTSEKDFVWGSNAVAANQGILMLQAFRITKDKKYLEGALSNLDYILGRNATGYSFITGFGDKTPMHIHHRPSEADGIAEPVPGLLAGGPNPGMQDRCKYSSSIPDEAYVDDVCSYASNEVAINWNAQLVYLSGAIEALESKK
jgi:endoglucanase